MNIINNIKKVKSNRLLKDYVWVFLGQNIGSVFSMLSVVVTLRIISSFDYGSLVIIQTYCLLISNIFCLRTFNGVIKFIAEAEQKNDTVLVKQYINTAFILDISMGVIAFIFGFLLLKPITMLMGWDTETVKYVYMYMPAILTYPFLNGTPIGVLRKTGHFKEVNVVHAIVYGLQLLVLVLMWIMRFGSFRFVLIEYAVIEMFESILLIVLTIRVMNKNHDYSGFWKEGITRNFSFIKYNFSYGLLATFDQVLGNVSTLLINKYVGNLATAYLKIITRICSILSKLTNPVSQIFYPELCAWTAKKQFRKALEVCKKYFIVVFSIGSLILVIMFATYDWWIAIFDAGMSSAKIQSILYLVYSVLSMSVICIHQLSYAFNMMRFNLMLVGVIDLLYIICLIPCVQTYGIEGYLILQIIQLISVVIGKYIYIQRRIKGC